MSNNEYKWMCVSMIVLLLALMLMAGISSYFKHVEKMAEIQARTMVEGGAI